MTKIRNWNSEEQHQTVLGQGEGHETRTSINAGQRQPRNFKLLEY